MKTKNLKLAFAVSAIMSSSAAFSEAEVTGKIIHESAKFTESGTTIGAGSSHGKDVFKTETAARIFIDGDLEDVREGATYHVELQAFNDSKGIGEHDGNESYTQRDALREAYIDTEYEDWSIRAGKQQVVWGTADGMKLLDMINPTDYSEMAQNQMEDSRIPVWMLNAEKELEDGGNVQAVISQPKENVFSGLDRNISTSVKENTNDVINGSGVFVDLTTGSGHSQGNAFIMKGVDSITGKTNGFLNIAPDLGSVARAFDNGFGGSAGLNATGNLNNAKFAGFSVGGFSELTMESMGRALEQQSIGDGGSTSAGDDADDWKELPPNFQGAVSNVSSQAFSGSIAEADITGAAMLEYGFGSAYDSNLTSHYSSSGELNSAFEYMDRATFQTFDAFVGAKSQYVYNMPSGTDSDVALRYKNSTKDGTNYSLNYAYAYDKNPIINISWRDASGNKVEVARGASFNVDTTGDFIADYQTSVLTLSGLGGTAGVAPTLRFEQTVEKAQNLGGSFDTAIETEALGAVVIRGEGLYQKGVYSPVMDRGALSIGDLPAALTMVEGDRFKYVLGVDITALTNMMVSMQFIQDRNLDFIDQNVDYDGSTCASGLVNCGKYTTDYATMHLTNGFNKAEENKEFYSLFLSKPFGASGEHRWNNIFMFEENGGKWNRLDAEFSIDDDTQVTAEYNKYWGDANTQFGQLEASSNVQIGFKYSF